MRQMHVKHFQYKNLLNGIILELYKLSAACEFKIMIVVQNLLQRVNKKTLNEKLNSSRGKFFFYLKKKYPNLLSSFVLFAIDSLVMVTLIFLANKNFVTFTI